MLFRNLNPMKGLLNGTRLIVKSIYQDSLDLEIITGTNVGQQILFYCYLLTYPLRMRLFHFHLSEGNVITINKTQGKLLT